MRKKSTAKSWVLKINQNFMGAELPERRRQKHADPVIYHLDVHHIRENFEICCESHLEHIQNRIFIGAASTVFSGPGPERTDRTCVPSLTDHSGDFDFGSP